MHYKELLFDIGRSRQLVHEANLLSDLNLLFFFLVTFQLTAFRATRSGEKVLLAMSNDYMIRNYGCMQATLELSLLSLTGAPIDSLGHVPCDYLSSSIEYFPKLSSLFHSVGLDPQAVAGAIHAGTLLMFLKGKHILHHRRKLLLAILALLSHPDMGWRANILAAIPFGLSLVEMTGWLQRQNEGMFGCRAQVMQFAMAFFCKQKRLQRAAVISFLRCHQCVFPDLHARFLLSRDWLGTLRLDTLYGIG